MKSSVLILSSPNDTHAESVARHLEAAGISPDYWTSRDLLKNWALSFELSNSDFACRLNDRGQSTGKERALSDYSSVWLRRPGKVATTGLPEKWMDSFVENEANRALDSIYRLLPCRWINPPLEEHNSRYKPVQLAIAKDCGLSIPDTIITNNPDTVRDFYDRCDRQVIYKLVDEASNLYFPQHEVPPGVVTMPFRDLDLNFLEQVRCGMHLFQRRIDKTCDLRVTVVGDELFAAKIESQTGQGKVDFRLDYSVPIREHQLPESVGQQIRQLMARLGLFFGAVDMCLDQDGNYQFFEVNPSGQWLWIEEGLNLPISKAVAAALVGSL